MKERLCAFNGTCILVNVKHGLHHAYVAWIAVKRWVERSRAAADLLRILPAVVVCSSSRLVALLLGARLG